MKQLCLAIIIALSGITAAGMLPARDTLVYAQKRDNDKKGDDKKKDPPGPPVVKEKGPKDKEKERPPRGRRPD